MNEIVIEVSSFFIAVAQGLSEDLARELLSEKIVTFETRDGQLHNFGTTISAWQSIDSSLVIPAGSVPRVTEILRQRGYTVTINDERDLDRDAFRWNRDEEDRAEQICPGIVASLRDHQSGVLQVPRGQSRAQTIGAICGLYSQARVFVVTARIESTTRLHAEIAEFVGGNVQSVHGGSWESHCRVVCGTLSSFESIEFPGHWDILIFEDARESICTKTSYWHSHFGHCLRFAFVNSLNELASLRLIEVESLAGPTIFPREEDQCGRAIDAHFADVIEEPFADSSSPREYREQLWMAPRRNDAIVQIAQALVQRAPTPLWDHGLFLPEVDPFSRWPQGCLVTILVESSRHAELLGNELTDWPVVTRRPRGQIRKHRKGLWRRSLVLDRSIVTVSAAAELECFSPHIVILANGGPSIPIELLQRIGRLTVIDFTDRVLRRHRDDTEARRQDYQSLASYPTSSGSVTPNPEFEPL